MGKLRTRQCTFRVRLAAFVVSVGIALAGHSAHAATVLDPERFATIAIDAASGEVLYAKKADARRYPASITKVMTLYLVFDALERGDLRLSDPVIISPRAASRPPSKLGLPAGQRLTVREAIDVLVVKSANDVATALGETLAGTEAEFARRMTAKAKTLGMRQTEFRNASGLPDAGQVTTARDLAILGRALLRNHPDYYGVFSQQQTVFRGRVIRGHNALLRNPGIDGFKTGFTNASGFNLLTSGARDGRRVIAVVLGGRSAPGRDRYMRSLMRASFATLAIRSAGNEVSVGSLLDADYEPLDAKTFVASAPAPAGGVTARTAVGARERLQLGASSRFENGNGVSQARFVKRPAQADRSACDLHMLEDKDCLASSGSRSAEPAAD